MVTPQISPDQPANPVNTIEKDQMQTPIATRKQTSPLVVKTQPGRESLNQDGTSPKQTLNLQLLHCQR